MSRRFLLLLLPLLLLLLSGAGLGCYFETNDDLTVVALLRGETAAAPVTDLYLYFHGFAWGWSQLYAAHPTVPWYGLTLYGLLYVATVLVFAVLWRLLRPHAGCGAVLAVLVLFWGVGWLEHSLWFNYMRVPLLLAGAGMLFAAQRAPVRWALAVGVLAFGISWLIRPSAAILGAAVAAPGAWWLTGRRSLPVLAGAGAWAVVGALWLNLTWSPAAATFRRLDVLKSNLNDFQLSAPPSLSLSPPDSLGLAAARNWMLADSTLVNEPMFARAAPFRLGYFLTKTASVKVLLLLRQLPRDYFPLLLLLVATGVLLWRQPRSRWFWLVQIGYVGLLLGLGAVLKLPPRLALPLLDFWAISNLIFVFGRQPLPRRTVPVLLAVLALAAVPYGYKTWHRSRVLAREQQRNYQQRENLYRLAGLADMVVSDLWEETYKSQSPLTEGHLPGSYAFRIVKPRKHLSLLGWQTLHPSQPALRRQLTGSRDFTAALRRLGRLPNVAWLLSPEGAALLNRHLALRRQPEQPLMQLVPAQPNRRARKNAMHADLFRAKFPHSSSKAKIL
ncbi:hypothetical protein ACFPAF_01000 [Hymenobacter endophyticus]|uniref:Glycosyltransferase RgtA/B/C/D-like domain-containing protein n=1 Tax=Hymenobacter endophyticus TaxID=3076335 RepID=A0ABU3TCF2_9BACT|nr:hypothetical protein [Hymenobacter endophyticus]MDU0368955.1 hypothetical protein [Hymenobacter endophyticus]